MITSSSAGRRFAVSPYLLLALTALFWAGNWTIARAMQDSLSPLAMAFWRWFAALVILLPFIGRALLAERTLIRRHWKILAVLGVLGVGCFNTFVYLGLRYTTVTTGVLLNSVTPVLILVVGWAFLRERVRIGQVAGITLSLAGVLAIVAQGEWGRLAGLVLNPGDLWVLGAVAAWAVYTVLLRWRPAELSSAAFTGVLIAVGVLAIAPLYAWDYAQGARVTWSWAVVLAIGYFAIFPSVLAYYFWNAAVAQVGGHRSGLFLHLVPLFGAGLSVMVLGETLRVYHALGAALIFGGIAVATRSRGE